VLETGYRSQGIGDEGVEERYEWRGDAFVQVETSTPSPSEHDP
jgi:hypothetical protein